jgi:DNA mismatch endonuclease (patch repair protein)
MQKNKGYKAIACGPFSLFDCSNFVVPLGTQSKMVDNLTKAIRSKVMRSVKSSGTGPELVVRKLTFALGYRYRLKKPRLPGRPDLIFPGRCKVIFIHGCFWHAHFWPCPRCPISREPDGEFWKVKLINNQKRDKRVIRELEEKGWKCLVIWECELKNLNEITKRITNFLG